MDQEDCHSRFVLMYQIDGAFINSASGLAYAPIVLILLILLTCVYRAYKTTLQRLTLYHILIVLFCECIFALQMEINYEAPRWICVIISYFLIYCRFTFYIYTTAVTNFLFIFTIYLLKVGNIKFWKDKKLVECVCLVAAVVLPMAYIWIPAHDRSYQVLSCDSNDTTRWNEDAVILNVLVLVMCVEVVIVCAIFSGLFCYLRWRLQNRKLSTMLKNLLYLTVINTAIMVFIAMEAVYSMYRYSIYRYSRPPSQSLNIIAFAMYSAGEPFFVFVSASFQFYLSILRQNYKICTCRKRDRTAAERQCMEDVTNDTCNAQTNPTSCPMNQPSHTYFSVPYTGAFSQITEHNEETPLLNNKASI